MARYYTTKDGDVLDLICLRTYGAELPGAVEAVLQANYGMDLPRYSPVLPRGLTIALPDMSPALSQAPLVKLWD